MQTPWQHDLRSALDEALDQHRTALRDSLDGLTEEEARLRLVPSRTTLLGLVKHVTFVEKVWFDEAFTGRCRKEMGVASTPDRSFVLAKADAIDSIRLAYERACAESRATVAAHELDDRIEGRGRRSVWAVYLHMTRELAQHCGHADILREQVLARRRG